MDGAVGMTTIRERRAEHICDGRDTDALLDALDTLIRATEFSAWKRDGEDVATIALTDLDRLAQAVADAKETAG